MKLIRVLLSTILITVIAGGILAGCEQIPLDKIPFLKQKEESTQGSPEKDNQQEEEKTDNDSENTSPSSETNGKQDSETNKQDPQDKTTVEEEKSPYANDPKVDPTTYHDEAIQVVADPNDATILVNKQYKLPDNYEPKDLVYPNVPFIFSEKIEKRKLRKVAAKALEEMFAGAEKDGIHLAGASGYRSQSTQVTIYNNYVGKDGVKKADRYSARPGHSEHQTGLAIDVSGTSGECAVEECFADTPEAKWIAEHAHEYGFILRYPKDKENLTGYMYESWHIRYVGKEIAKEVYDQDITLEEYYNVAIPVTTDKEEAKKKKEANQGS